MLLVELQQLRPVGIETHHFHVSTQLLQGRMINLAVVQHTGHVLQLIGIDAQSFHVVVVLLQWRMDLGEGEKN